MLLKNKKIAVLCGGLSEEREISLRTGEAIFNALKKLKFKAVKIDAQKDLAARLLRQKIDFCFIALHGKGGEDGVVQGLCESLQIPHTGSGVLASALTMNKIAAKRVLKSEGFLSAKFVVAGARDLKALPRPGPFPWIVKPADSGSAFGVSLVHKKNELGKAARNALQYSRQILIEEYIQGTEISVPILGARALPIIQIVPQDSPFYDFKAKYVQGASRHIIPAEISANLTRKIQNIALRIHHLLGCRAFSRIDFILDKKGRAFFLEVNTMPGMTQTSLFPESARAAGITFEKLVAQMIALSLP